MEGMESWITVLACKASQSTVYLSCSSLALYVFFLSFSALYFIWWIWYKNGWKLVSTQRVARRKRRTRPDFFLRSSRIIVNLLSYESNATDKQEQYNVMADKNLDGKEREKKRNRSRSKCTTSTILEETAILQSPWGIRTKSHPKKKLEDLRSLWKR